MLLRHVRTSCNAFKLHVVFVGCFVHATLVPLQRGRGGRRHRASCQVTEKARQSVGSLEPRRKTVKLAVPSPNQTKPNPHPVASKHFLRKSFLRGSLRHIQIRTHTARWNTSSIAKQPPGSLFVLYQTFSIYCYSCIYPQFHPISHKFVYDSASSAALVAIPARLSQLEAAPVSL